MAWGINLPLADEFRRSPQSARVSQRGYGDSGGGGGEPLALATGTLSPADGKVSAVTGFVLLDELALAAAVFTHFGLPATAPSN